MKINQLLSENELDEALPFTKQWKAQRASDKATKQSMRDELMNMEVELKTFMRTAKIKTATPEVVLNYLKQKGLGKAGQEVINNYVTGSQKMQNVATAAGQAVGKGIKTAKSAASAVGQAAKNVAGKLKPQDVEPAQDIDEPQPSNNLSAAQKARALQWQRSRFNEQVEIDTPLSARDVRNILQQVLTKGYAQSAGFGKSKFASDEPDVSQGVSPEVKAAMDTLRKAGFKVSK